MMGAPGSEEPGFSEDRRAQGRDDCGAHEESSREAEVVEDVRLEEEVDLDNQGNHIHGELEVSELLGTDPKKFDPTKTLCGADENAQSRGQGGSVTA